jgi:hypothetical protein
LQQLQDDAQECAAAPYKPQQVTPQIDIFIVLELASCMEGSVVVEQLDFPWLQEHSIHRKVSNM